MAAGAYDQRLYIIRSGSLTMVGNGPTGTNAFDDVVFLGRLPGRVGALRKAATAVLFCYTLYKFLRP
jgi:hypothetical protein